MKRYAYLYFDDPSLCEFNSQQKQRGKSCLKTLINKTSLISSDDEAHQKIKENLDTIRLYIEKRPSTNLVRKITSCLQQIYQFLKLQKNHNCFQILMAVGDSSSKERRIITQAIVDEAIATYYEDIEGYKNKIQNLSKQLGKKSKRKESSETKILSMHFAAVSKIEIYKCMADILETQKKMHQMQYVILYIKRSLEPKSGKSRLTSQLHKEIAYCKNLTEKLNTCILPPN